MDDFDLSTAHPVLLSHLKSEAPRVHYYSIVMSDTFTLIIASCIKICCKYCAFLDTHSENHTVCLLYALH